MKKSKHHFLPCNYLKKLCKIFFHFQDKIINRWKFGQLDFKFFSIKKWKKKTNVNLGNFGKIKNKI